VAGDLEKLRGAGGALFGDSTSQVEAGRGSKCGSLPGAAPFWTAPGAAPCLELLHFGPFGRALARAGFGAPPNRTLIF